MNHIAFVSYAPTCLALYHSHRGSIELCFAVHSKIGHVDAILTLPTIPVAILLCEILSLKLNAIFITFLFSSLFPSLFFIDRIFHRTLRNSFGWPIMGQSIVAVRA